MGIFQIIFFCYSVYSTEFSKQSWDVWKEKTFHEHLSKETSYLNATSLNSAVSGQTLYLQIGTDRRSTTWVDEKPEESKLLATAIHSGEKVSIEKNNGKTTELSVNKVKKEEWKLPNGAITQLSIGKTSNKLWTYIFDPDKIKKFKGFNFFPYNKSVIIEASFKKTKLKVVSHKTVQGDSRTVNKVGQIGFTLGKRSYVLPAYSWQKPGEKLSYLAMIFTDKTANKSTYGGGRELIIDLANGVESEMKITLDFNRSINFYCAHSPYWHCPVGLQKKIDYALNAGEMLNK